MRKGLTPDGRQAQSEWSAQGAVNPVAETCAAFEWHPSAPQDLPVSLATRESVLGTRQSARAPCWRGGGAPDKTRFRSFGLPCFHHPRSNRPVSPACQLANISRAFFQGAPDGEWGVWVGNDWAHGAGSALRATVRDRRLDRSPSPVKRRRQAAQQGWTMAVLTECSFPGGREYMLGRRDSSRARRIVRHRARSTRGGARGQTRAGRDRTRGSCTTLLDHACATAGAARSARSV
jgi:hypothetical protein